MLDVGLLNGDLNSFLSVVLGIFVVLSTCLTFILATAPSQYDPYLDKSLNFIDEEDERVDIKKKDGKALLDWKQGRTVQVVVLGDIGRSPRMQYHAMSIAKHGGRVFLIGYQESELHPDITASPLVHVIPLVPAPSYLRSSSRLLFPVIAPLKALWQAGTLYKALGYRSEPARWMLVQNPPSIPVLAISRLICFLRNTDLVIDWHNFGYTILALKLGNNHPLVKISALYERFYAKTAAQHFAVTDAMARVLKDDYGVTAQTLHDRPASIFRPITAHERIRVLKRLPETAPYANDLTRPSKAPWKLIISPTSWTVDEDFSLLLDALVTYSAAATLNPKHPRILAIITGKGPQKAYYLNKITQLNHENKLQNVIITTAWLTTEDYALLLASAHLGVSLHTSSSGVDLPMKVVDMFGAGLPVVGWGDFEAWPELVKEGINGLGFKSSEALSRQLLSLFAANGAQLETLRKGAVEESQYTWDKEWDRVGGKLFKLT